MKSFNIITHITSAIIITIIILLVYASVQQSFRASANDPQIQIARDVSAALSAQKPVDKYFNTGTINLNQSLAIFIEQFDANGKPLQSTGLLNGNPPQPPKGIFNFTNNNAEDILTWQPQPGVRLAMVFEKSAGPGTGFIAVGRSLKETEIREADLVKMAGLAWIACMVIIVLHFAVQLFLIKKLNKH